LSKSLATTPDGTVTYEDVGAHRLRSLLPRSMAGSGLFKSYSEIPRPRAL
jgi:hypothetical protein